ncbi:MAG TPA: alpha/beta fold hydrolase [Pseudonocardiaceae bacterium]
MPVTSAPTTFRTLDGLQLAGTVTLPDRPAGQAVVLVHGGGVTRDEGGFFTRLAVGLAEAGVASLRFDLRGHGESEGLQEELTLAAILNDIRVALVHVREATEASAISLLGASFGGGICAYYAAKRPAEVDRLVGQGRLRQLDRDQRVTRAVQNQAGRLDLAEYLRFGMPPTFVPIEGAQHGFAVDGDPEYRDPQTQAWQASVIHAVADWLQHDL